jgi:dolichol-phosphate mannosyltransferase
MADASPPAAGNSWRLSLVLPAYNEAAVIRQALAEAGAALARLAADYEILVVDDGSSDGTATAVEEAARSDRRVRLLRHPVNRGYGAALRTGFAAARFDRVAFTDADCQFHLDDLAPLLALSDRAPVAAGYRVGRQDPWQRRFFSWGYNRLVRALLGTRVRDCDCALKVFRRDCLGLLLPETSGFFVNTEMLTRARQLGYAVAEAGVRHRRRLGGVSKVSLTDIPRTLRTLLPFWWSRVLFPRPAGAARAGSAAPAPLAAVCLLLLVAGLLFFSRLGAPLQEPDEARYAEVPRQMLAEGSWVVPVLHGAPYPDKPPLLYWLVMGSYRLFGVHDWAARLVASDAAFLTVFVVYYWGRRALGVRAAFAGAMILCLSARFVHLGRLLTLDGLLCLWVTAALAAGHLAVQGTRLRRGWWLASALACGLGVLTKGPVALALTLPPLLALQALDPRTARPRGAAWSAYLALALAVAVPWYAAMAVCEPDFLPYFFWTHNVVRYVAPFDHAEPIWFHLPGLLLGMLPWALLLPGLARFLTRHSARTAARRPAALGFFLLAFVWGLLFYSLSGCKRPAYILPVLPPLALALGCYLDAVLPPARGWGLALARRLPAVRLAFPAAVLVLGGAATGSLAAVQSGLLKPGSGLLLVALPGVAMIALGLYAWRGKAVSWNVCGGVTFLALFTAIQILLPAYARRFSLRSDLRPQAGAAADPAVPVVCYPRRWDSVGFYLRRSDVQAFTPEQVDDLVALVQVQPKTLVVVKSDGALDELVRGLPGSVEFVRCGGGGHVTVGQVRPRPFLPDMLLAQERADGVR